MNTRYQQTIHKRKSLRLFVFKTRTTIPIF